MTRNELILEQRQTMSANQMQSLQILSYTNQELQEFLMEEYMENPLIECPMDKVGDNIQQLENYYERNSSYKDQYINNDEDDNNTRNDIKAPEKDRTREMILGQLHHKEYTKEEWKLMEYLTACLDDHGFFTWDIRDIARVLHYDEKTVEKCLAVLKTLEPAGIFSSGIGESLKIQLIRKGVKDETLLDIVENHMEEILEGRLSTVTRTMNLSNAKVKEYIYTLSTMEPYPISGSQLHNTQYIIPDILVSLENGKWKVEINDQWTGECKFNEYYLHMMRTTQDPTLKEYFQKKLERARFVMGCVEQRRLTIEKCVYAILYYQDDYFRLGTTLRPMNMEDVAKRINMSVSTVSRAIKDKYLRFRKTVPIRDLFQAGIKNQETLEMVSTDLIYKRIKELTDQEDPEKPLSDNKIAEILKTENITVSRRAVAKYRAKLGILDSRQRARYPGRKS